MLDEQHVHHGLEVFRQPRPQFIGRKALRDAGEPFEVREDHRHVAGLSAEFQAPRIREHLFDDGWSHVVLERAFDQPPFAPEQRVAIGGGRGVAADDRGHWHDDRQMHTAREHFA